MNEEAPSTEILIDYFTHAAEDVGKMTSEKKRGNTERKQANYSLLWYFKSCIIDDLNPKNSPLLAAYLDATYRESTEARAVLCPPLISKNETDEVKQLLKNGFSGDSELNESQIEAVHKALHYPISFIYGPPGTGKTETIVRIASLAVAKRKKVAIVSTNTAAVENVEDKLDKACKRYSAPDKKGYENRKNNDLVFAAARKHVCLGCVKRRNNAYDPLEGPSNEPDQNSLGFESEERIFPNDESVKGWEKNKRSEEFLGVYPLITSTIHSLKKCFADGDEYKYDLLIMDEASQANLIVGIVALSCAKRIVIVGDDNQLPPVVANDHKKEMNGFISQNPERESIRGSAYDICKDKGQSFLSSCRSVFKEPELETLLDVHYRCHPDIIGFCNREVYAGALQIEKPKNCETIDTKCPIRIRWYEGDYRERVLLSTNHAKDGKKEKKITEVVNRKQIAILEREEAAHIIELVKAKKSICILSPFRGQVHAVQNAIKVLLENAGLHDVEIEPEYYNTGEEQEEQDKKPKPNSPIQALTIHKSQGQEFDTVYLLPVEDGNWEWPWSQGKRLVNVAASRAKEELIVLVSTKLMSQSAQKGLAPYGVTPIEGTGNTEDDEDNEELLVYRLVDYVLGLRPLDRTIDEFDMLYGLHRSRITSVFDNVPKIQQSDKHDTRVDEDADDSAPERCMAKALKCMLENYANVGFKQNVPFCNLEIRTEGNIQKLRETEEVHFDFVVFEQASNRVLMAIEIDGAQHRFLSFGHIDNLDIATNDQTKNFITKEVCGAALCRLGPIPDYSRNNKAPDEKLNLSSWYNMNGSLEKWIESPDDIPESSSFVFLRIPSDGSTFWETDSLKPDKAEELIEDVPPTIEDYLEKQQEINQNGEQEKALYILLEDVQPEGQDEPESASFEGELGITLLLKHWEDQGVFSDEIAPKEANLRLEEAGLLSKKDNGWGTTSAGKRLGIHEIPPSKERSYYMCKYDSATAEKILPFIINDLESPSSE